MKDFLHDISGIKTHIIREGDGGRVILFLHGWGGSTKSFEALSARMRDTLSCETIRVDLPGFGTSDTPATGWDTHRYEAWFEALLAFLELGDREVILYGHSFGCRVMVRFLRKHAGWSYPVIFTGAAGIRWPLSLRQRTSVWVSKHCKRAQHLIPRKIQKFVLCRIFGARDWGCVDPGLKETLRLVLEEDDFREELTQITVPALVLWGEQDSITPLRSGQVYADKLPDSTLITYPAGRHGIHYTHTEDIVRDVEQFLIHH